MQQRHRRRRGHPLLPAPRRRRARAWSGPSWPTRAPATAPAGRLDADHAVRPPGHGVLHRPSPQRDRRRDRDTPGRKLREMRLRARRWRQQLTKDQILERYLNIAPFGNGAYGIYAASQVYFGKQPKDLTLAQAALLAGLVKAPSTFDPHDRSGSQGRDGPPGQLRTAQHGQDGLHHPGRRMHAGHRHPARASSPATPSPTAAPSVANNNWGFFCDYFYRWWLDQPAFGADAVRAGEPAQDRRLHDRHLAGRQGPGVGRQERHQSSSHRQGRTR